MLLPTAIFLFPRYRWDVNKKMWILRTRNLCKNRASGNLSDSIGRIPIINLNAHQSELYFLRMLLHHKPGPTSFEDLRTIDGVLQSTFQAACLKLGLLEDDNEIYEVFI